MKMSASNDVAEHMPVPAQFCYCTNISLASLQVALAATCIVVCLDHRYRPTRILPEWKQKLMLGRSPEDLSNGNGASDARVIQKVSM